MLLLFYFVWLVGGIEIDVFHDGFGNLPAEKKTVRCQNTLRFYKLRLNITTYTTVMVQSVSASTLHAEGCWSNPNRNRPKY